VAAKSSRWVLNVILVVAVLALIGFSMLPLLNATLEAGQQPSPSPNAVQSAPVSADARKADLEAQVRGYEMVLQREPENVTALQGVLDARLMLLNDFKVGEAKALIDPLEKLASLKPDQSNYNVLLAQTKEYFKDPEGAAQAYRAALSRDPSNPYALTGLVKLYLTQKKPEAAIGFLQTTLAAKPGQAKDQISVQVLLAEVYTELKRFPEALATYDDAIATDARDFRPHLGKARVLVAQSKPQDAKLAYDQAFSLAPANYKDAIRQEREPLQTEIKAETPKVPNSKTSESKPDVPTNPVPVTTPVPAQP
jgi:tetratricopeptide (TPR) repeat protein